MQRKAIFNLLLLLYFSAFFADAGKAQCQKYRDKLDNIQGQQRQSNSLKRSNSLSVREDRARDTWWKCETGKLKAPSKKKKLSKKKPKQKKQVHHYKAIKTNKPLVPFASSRPIIAKAKYTGEQQQAWLSFFQPNKACARPKSTQQFVACVEDKRQQQIEFEKRY